MTPTQANGERWLQQFPNRTCQLSRSGGEETRHGPSRAVRFSANSVYSKVIQTLGVQTDMLERKTLNKISYGVSA